MFDLYLVYNLSIGSSAQSFSSSVQSFSRVSIQTNFKQVYSLVNLSQSVFEAEALTSIPPYLSADFVVRKGASKESITEILVADLGDAVSQTPYLIVSSPTLFFVLSLFHLFSSFHLSAMSGLFF